MRFQVILNRDGGTLRTRDVERFAAGARRTLEGLGHAVSVTTVAGEGLEKALAVAAAGPAEVVMVGGGDGTVSAAAAQLAHTDKALAVLPAGTMNLFARSLGIPLDLDAAVAALGAGAIEAVDVAAADDRIFVHQFSVGLHAKLIRLREKKSFGSRLGKMRASVAAGLSTFFRPPRLEAELVVDGAVVVELLASRGGGAAALLCGVACLDDRHTPGGGAARVAGAVVAMIVVIVFAEPSGGVADAVQEPGVVAGLLVEITRPVRGEGDPLLEGGLLGDAGGGLLGGALSAGGCGVQRRLLALEPRVSVAAEHVADPGAERGQRAGLTLGLGELAFEAVGAIVEAVELRASGGGIVEGGSAAWEDDPRRA